jgi:SAM-dependent methyltransferase
MIRCPQCRHGYARTVPACPACGHAPARRDQIALWSPEWGANGEGFRPEYFARLFNDEAGSFWFRSRNALIIWALERYFPRFARLLEVGCGTGYVLSGLAERFPSAALTGSDAFPEGLRFAAQRVPRAEFLQMDARRTPFEDEFDVVAAFDVLEHIEDDAAVLASLFRSVKPGGGLLITVPQHRWLWSPLDDYSCHVRRYDAAGLHAKVRAAGFEIVRSTSTVTLLLPAMLLSRLRMRSAAALDAGAEYRIAPVLNRALERMLGLERWAIRLGLDLPVGGSRLVVARKPEHPGEALSLDGR